MVIILLPVFSNTNGKIACTNAAPAAANSQKLKVNANHMCSMKVSSTAAGCVVKTCVIFCAILISCFADTKVALQLMKNVPKIH